MPPVPSFFSNADLRDLMVFFVIFMTMVVLAIMRRLPDPWAVKHYVSALNDRGGNIIVLSLLTMWFFSVSVRIFYYAFELLSQKKLEADNAILLMSVQFVTSSAFGGSFGALLKTMTGSDSMARGGDVKPIVPIHTPLPPTAPFIPPPSTNSASVTVTSPTDTTKE